MQGRRGIIVVGAGAAVLALLLIFFLVLPKMSAVTEAEKELEDTTAQQAVLQGRLTALRQARDEAPENQATIRQIEGLVPPTAELSAVILLLRNAATVAGVQVVSLTPAAPVASTTGGFSTISVSASGECSYFAMVKYLHEIETLPRAATVEAVSLTPVEGTLLSFTATITLYTSDLSAGPGSEPGPTESLVTTPGG
jgi:Tfp pilus assembly protein PilO